MAYTLDFGISLGSGRDGLTLAAQIIDSDGNDVGAEITTGFVEIGGGTYILHCTTIPNGHRGGIKFYEDGVPGTILSIISINPEDISPGYSVGCSTFTYTLTDSISTLPIQGADVWLTTDVAGTNVVWRGDTDTFGVARDAYDNLICVDAGPYYFWRYKPGYRFDDPDTHTVG